MKPHPRIRKTIKWGGAGVTALLLVAWIIGGWRSFYVWYTPTTAIRVSRGRAEVTHVIAGRSIGTTIVRGTARPEPFRLEWAWSSYSSQYSWIVCVPLWMPGAAMFIVFGLAWRQDAIARRRERAHLCPKCGYDRTGILKDAKCPECGSGGAAPASG
jgi:hypothetical protein